MVLLYFYSNNVNVSVVRAVTQVNPIFLLAAYLYRNEKTPNS
ncbi:hypothetical protein SynROS8604_01183 [Synechococcus sp. ROS8604]|nr:hypothetical protein SynROS8604_01183 [Synechococcus sp. ROS8604]